MSHRSYKSWKPCVRRLLPCGCVRLHPEPAAVPWLQAAAAYLLLWASPS